MDIAQSYEDGVNHSTVYGSCKYVLFNMFQNDSQVVRELTDTMVHTFCFVDVSKA
jgi:hypothetical protein